MSENSSTIQQKELSAGWKAIRFFYGVLIFLIAGPPIGSVVFLSAYTIAGALRESPSTFFAPFVDILRVLPSALVITTLASYVLGWLPALIAGIVVSAGQVYSSGRSTAIAAVLTSSIAPALSHIIQSRGGSGHPTPIGLHAVLAITSITATMSCWWILRKVGISGYKRS